MTKLYKIGPVYFWLFFCGLFIFLSGPASPSLGGPQAAMAQAAPSDSGADIPLILPRSVWDNTPELQTLMDWYPESDVYPSDWQPVERVVIHDTATPNDDPLSPIARIQSIYRFHAVTNGWGDIGYNYLIDRDGKIYEGRLGGNGSRGAHASNGKTNQNFNYGSVGISLLGEYSATEVPPVMVQSLEKLIGWLAAVNNFDPACTQKTFSIWDPTVKNFSQTYTGPVVVGHKDIDKAKPDPGTLDEQAVRLAAAQYKQEYQGIIYEASDSSKVYSLTSGTSTVFSTISDYTAAGLSYTKLALIPQTQLDMFSQGRFLKNPDGSLLKFAGSPAVYLIDGGQKRFFSVTSKQFSKLGYDPSNVTQVLEGELDLYPPGPDIIYGTDKSLIKDSTGKIYYIDAGRKHWISSNTLFSALGYKFKNVKAKSDDYAATILDGAPKTYPTGTLAKGSGATVYLFDNGQKREFLSAQSFAKLGYKSNKILSLTDAELALYPDGQFVNYKNGTLIKSPDDPTVYVVSGNQKKAIISNEEFANLGYKTKNILAVSSDELNNYILASNVTYPDGTAVQMKGDTNVYQVKNGLANLVPDTKAFKKLKLSWAKVLKISVDDFSKLFGQTASAATITAPAPSATQLVPQTQSNPVISAQPNIRVGVWSVPDNQTSVVFLANGPYDVYDKSGNILASRQGGEQYPVNTTDQSGVFAKFVPKPGTILQVVSLNDPAWNNVTNYNQFRGNLELVYSNKSSKLWVVNELPLEDYLKGVAETSQGLAMEYLKTMSVAARTYAYNYQKQGGKYGSNEVYHITNTTADQLYKGYSREQYATDILTAVAATTGEIVTYNGNPIVTAYSSGAPELMTNGSKSACSVWGGKYCQPGFEYLAGGVKDPAGTTYTLTACGNGNHCVGLSGAGTRQLAAQGKTYKDILTYYYPGTAIQKIY